VKEQLVVDLGKGTKRGSELDLQSNGPGNSMADFKSITARVFEENSIIARSLKVTGPFNLTTSLLNYNVS
jgi:hypothetical protein